MARQKFQFTMDVTDDPKEVDLDRERKRKFAEDDLRVRFHNSEIEVVAVGDDDDDGEDGDSGRVTRLMTVEQINEKGGDIQMWGVPIVGTGVAQDGPFVILMGGYYVFFSEGRSFRVSIPREMAFRLKSYGWVATAVESGEDIRIHRAKVVSHGVRYEGAGREWRQVQYLILEGERVVNADSDGKFRIDA